MGHWANVKFDTLFDVTRRGANLHVRCRCGHSSVVDAAKLQRWYSCHRWLMQMQFVGEHLWCSKCHRRPVKVGPIGQAPTAPDCFPQTEADWERVVKRLRGVG